MVEKLKENVGNVSAENGENIEIILNAFFI